MQRHSHSQSIFKLTMYMYILTCILTIVSSARNFTEDIGPLMSYVMTNGLNFDNIDDLPIDDEVKELAMDYYEMKMEEYLTLVRNDLDNDYKDTFNQTITDEVMLMLPNTYSDALRKNIDTKVADIRKKTKVKELEKRTLDEIYAKYQSDIDNLPNETKEYFKNEVYGGDPSVDSAYTLAWNIGGNTVMQKLHSHVKNVINQEIASYSKEIAKEIWIIVINDCEDKSKPIVYITNTQVILNKEQFVPWNLQMKLTFNIPNANDDFNFIKPPIIQEFSIVSTTDLTSKLCTIKYDKKYYNQQLNTLDLNFVYGCIDYSNISNPYFIIMSLSKLSQFYDSYIKTYYFNEQLFTIIDDTTLNNENIISNLRKTESNTWMLLSLITLEPQYQHGILTLEYSLDKTIYHSVSLDLSNQYSTTLARDNDESINLILYNNEHHIILAQQNVLLKSAGDTFEMFASRYALFNVDDTYHYITCSFSKDVFDKVINIYFNNELIGKKELGVNDITIRLPKKDNDNTLVMFSFERDNIIYPGFSIYQGNVNGTDINVIESFLGKYSNTIRDYMGLVLNDKQIERFDTFINDFKGSLEDNAMKMFEQVKMLLLSDVNEVINDVVKCKNNEMIDINYATVNKVMNMVDSVVNRNDILILIQIVLNEMLNESSSNNNVSDKIIESIALKLSQGFYIYADYTLPVMLLQLIQNEINNAMKNACEGLSLDNKPPIIVNDVNVEFKQKEIVEWYTSSDITLTLVIKEGQTLFEEFNEYTIGLTRINGVTMYCQTTFIYTPSQLETHLTFPANCLTYIDNEVIPESNVYMLSYMTDTSNITVNVNAVVTVIKHKLCPNPFKHLISGNNNVVYVFNSFELYDTTSNEVVIIEANSNAVTTTPQYGETFKVIVYSGEGSIVYANDNVLYIEDILATPETNIILPSNTNTIKVELKTSSTTTTPVVIYAEQTQLITSQFQSGSSIIIDLPLNDIINSNTNNNGQFNIYIEYHNYKTKSFTLYFADYLSQIQNVEYTYQIFDILYTWISPCSDVEISFTEIETTTTPHLTHLTESLTQFTSTYVISIDETYYQNIIEQSILDIFLTANNDESWRDIVDDDDYPREQFLLDKVMELFTSEQIHSTLLQYINDLLIANDEISTILTSFKADLLNELINTIHINEAQHYKYISHIETTIKDISTIYAQKILFIYLEQKYIDKLRSFTNTFVLELYNAITSTQRIPIQITTQAVQTNKLQLIPWNMLLHLQITDETVLNIQTNMNINFLLSDTTNNSDYCVTSVTITNPLSSPIAIAFPNNCISLRSDTSNTYVLGYKESITWFDIPIEKVYQFTSINIKLIDPLTLPKPTNNVFTNYKQYPLDQVYFLNAPTQNPTANIFCEYKTNSTNDNVFQSSPSLTTRDFVSYVVYDITTKQILHAEQDIMIISHELTLLNPTVIHIKNKALLIGLSFDSDVSSYDLVNNIYVGNSKTSSNCITKANTIIECEIVFAYTTTYKLHGKSQTAHTNTVSITLIAETALWDPTTVEVCQYGLQPKQITLGGSNTTLINNVNAALISSNTDITTLTKHNSVITFPIINASNEYVLSLYEVDPLYAIANTNIKFVTPYIDIKNKHIQIKGQDKEVIAIGGVICSIEGLRLMNVNTNVSSDIICNENTESNNDVYVCNVNTAINEGQYNLYNGDLIFDTFDVTIPFMEGNFNFISDSLCLVTSLTHVNVFEITSLNYPIKYIDEVVFRSLSLSSNITTTIHLSEDNSTLFSSVLFEIEGNYQPVLVYNGEEVVMDVVVNPLSNLFALNNKYVVLPYTTAYGKESVIDIEVTLLFDYGEANVIVFNSNNNTVDCVVEEVGKCKITYTVNEPIDIQLSIPCSQTVSSEVEMFYVFYFNNDYTESEMKCLSKGMESKDKLFTLLSHNGIGDNELYIYIENEMNEIVYEKRITSNNGNDGVNENKINSYEMLSKLNEGMYSIKVGNENHKYEMDKINIEKLITIKSINDDNLLAGFSSQTIDIELTEASNENKIKTITIKPLNNNNINELTITCTFMSEVLLQCDNVDLSNIPQGKTLVSITNVCGDITQKQIDLPWTTITSISPPSIDYNNKEHETENTFTITFTDTLPSTITEITVDFINSKTNQLVLTTQFTLTSSSTYTSTISSSSLPGALYKIKASHNDYTTTYPINANDYYDIIPKCDVGYIYDPAIHDCIATVATSCDACDKKGTTSCKTINKVSYCTCKHNYYGVLCDEYITNASNDYNNLLNQLDIQKEITQIQMNIINKLIILTSSYQNTLSQQELPINEINTLRDHTMNILHQQNAKYNDMLNLVTLSIKNEILKLKRLRQHKKTTRMRVLSEVNETEDEIKQTINSLLISTAECFTNQATELQLQPQNLNEALLTYTNTHLLVQTWFSNSKSKQHAKNNATELNLTWIESIPCLDDTNNDQYVFSKVEMLSETSSDIYESTQSNIIAFKAKRIETTTTTTSSNNNNNIALVNWNNLHCDNNNSIIITVPINNANVNETRYNKAADIGVKMYDSKSRIYSDSCYRKHSLPYDITAKEMENILGDDIKVINPLYNTCIFDTIDFNASKVVLNCKFDNDNNNTNTIVGYAYEDYPKEVKYDSVFECSDDVEHFEKNIGVYISIVLLVVILIVQIVCGVAKNKKNLIIEDHINSALVNDGIEERKILNKTMRTTENQKTDCNIHTSVVYNKNNNNNNINTSTPPEKVQLQKQQNYELEHVPSFIMFKIKKGRSVISEENKQELPTTTPKDTVQISTNTKDNTSPDILDDNQIDIQIKSFCSVFCNNFLELFPFINTCHASIITPFVLRSAFNFFNLIILLGFNACYYTNTYLNERIKHSNRDDFIYPITHDITRIIVVIVSSMILTVIMRLIVLVTYKRKEELANEIKVCQNNNEPIKKFTDEMFVRRLIVQILMLVITLFVFYFTFAFCNRYPKAQYSWAYSVVWSVIFNYVPLSLIYILVVSIVETHHSNKCSSCVYYAKRVFMF